MAINTIRWTISVYNLATDSWGAYVNIRNPDTKPITFSTISTVQLLGLQNGGEAMILPETKFLKEAVGIEWNNVFSGASILGDIKDYTENSSGIRIKTHTEIFSGAGLEVIEGRFIDYTISMQPMRDYIDRQLFGISATFKPISIIVGTGF